MAISGAGGWVPSVQVGIVNRRLWRNPISQNKPPEIVFRDMEQAAAVLCESPDRFIQIDCRGFNTCKLTELLRTAAVID